MMQVNYNNLPNKAFANYMQFLISQFFKILPTYEQEPETLKNYLSSLQIEMMGSQSLIQELKEDAQFLRLLNTIQYFIDSECEHSILRREIFKCIRVIENLQEKYSIRLEWFDGH